MQINYFNKKITAPLIITIVIGYFLLKQTDYKNIFLLFKEINYGYVLISFLFYFLLTFIRALRIKLLVNNKIGINNLFAIVLVNNLVINLLPFRTGELSLPVLLKKYVGVEKREGFLLLFYLRTIDMIIILTSVIIIVLLFSGNIIQFRGASYISTLLLLAFLFLALFKIDKIILIAGKIAQKRNHCGLLNSIVNSVDKLSLIYKFYKSRMKEISILSILIFITLAFVFGFVLRAYPIDLSYVDIIMISLIIIVTTSLPVNGIAGIGIVELGISSFLILLGINKNLSVSIAFNYHFIYLMFIIFFGSLSFLYLHYKKHTERNV